MLWNIYDLNERSIEIDLIPWCTKNNVAVMGYSPLRELKNLNQPVLDEIAHRHNATKAGVVLAYLTRDPNVFGIPKSSHTDRAAENMYAMDIILSDEEIGRIRKAYPIVKRKSLRMVQYTDGRRIYF